MNSDSQLKRYYQPHPMSQKPDLTRRSLIKTCAMIAAATSLPSWFVQSQLEAAETSPAKPTPTSPNSRPGIALIGCGGMGMVNLANAASYGDVVALCDVDKNHLSGAAQKYTINGKMPATYTDFRKLLENKDVTTIIQATPDHWHTLVNLAAARAGKDIYGEKPLTLTIDEGQRVIKEVRDRKLVFQCGMVQRSNTRFRLACELVRNGRIGKLTEVQVFVPAGIRGNGFKQGPVPPQLDFDFWLGPTPQVEYVKERVHGNFRWWWDYAGGPVTDWGAHHNDIARWAIGLDGPVSIDAQVITPPLPDGYTTPSEFTSTLMWANGVKQTVKTTTDDGPGGTAINPDGQRNGIRFVGTDGWIWVNRSELDASSKDLLTTPLPDNAIRLEVSKNHVANFFDSLTTRKDPIASIEIAHRSACIGHLITIALRTGLKLEWDPVKEIFTGANAAEANRHLAREMRKPYGYDFIA